MSRHPLDPKSRWFPFAASALLLIACIAWPLTLTRKALKPKPAPRRVSLSRELKRAGIMPEGCAEEGGNHNERRVA